MKRKKVNKDFFKQWSPSMAYVLGFFLADGGMTINSRGGHFITFYSADRDILNKIQGVMKSEHKLSRRSEGSGGVYRFQIGSKEIFNDLLKLGCDVKKTNRLKLPEIPKRYVGQFVRGYFDGDGNVWMGIIHKNRKIKTPVIQVAFTSGSKNFLKDLRLLLQRQGVRGGSVYTSKKGSFSRLSYSTLDALKLYEIMYNVPSKLYLKRKKLVFEKFIKMRL